MRKIILILFFPVMVLAQDSAEYDFGRLFTTPRERLRLDELRIQRPQEQLDITLSPELIDQDPDDSPVEIPISTIEVNGLVYRSDGKNMAWINQKTSQEGSLENQYTKVSEQDISPNEVNITLPDNESRIGLKVGQRFDVNSQTIIDIDEDTRPTVNLSSIPDSNSTVQGTQEPDVPTPNVMPPPGPPGL